MDHAGEQVHERVFERLREAQDTTYKTATAGSVIEALGGIGVVALSIIGLAGVIPETMAAIAAIAFGVALASEGAAIAARFSQLTRYPADTVQKTEVSGGAGSELIGGLAGGILGILALIGMVPVTLLAIASIVFGASILLGAGTASRLSLAVSHTGEHWLASDTLAATAGAQVLVGVAAIALGILALVGTAPMTLVLVAFLSLGSAAVIQGSAIGGSLVAMFH
jgi:hypothetical protein